VENLVTIVVIPDFFMDSAENIILVFDNIVEDVDFFLDDTENL
jgi:hypothetical protein